MLVPYKHVVWKVSWEIVTVSLLVTIKFNSNWGCELQNNDMGLPCCRVQYLQNAGGKKKSLRILRPLDPPMEGFEPV